MQGYFKMKCEDPKFQSVDGINPQNELHLFALLYSTKLFNFCFNELIIIFKL